MKKVKSIDDAKIKQAIIEIVKTISPECIIILYGSRAKGNETAASDYDIAIKSENKIPASLIFSIEEEIDKLSTLKAIEIVDYHKLDRDFQSIVLKEGIILYDGTGKNTA